MFDRRANAFVTYNAFLFVATYVDGPTIEVQVNPEFGTPAAAFGPAEYLARATGQLPAALRVGVQTMWIHFGNNDFGGGNNNLLIHTGRAEEYLNTGILEQVLVHEAAHFSLDSQHANAPGWLAAQAADPEFISTYARDNPTREDAESFLPYLAVRHRRDRIAASLATTIEQTIPTVCNILRRKDSTSSRSQAAVARWGPPHCFHQKPLVVP